MKANEEAPASVTVFVVQGEGKRHLVAQARVYCECALTSDEMAKLGADGKAAYEQDAAGGLVLARERLQRLRDHCQAAMAGPAGAFATVTLTRQGEWGRRSRLRLWGYAGGPMGKIVRDQGDGHVVAQFKAAEVLASCDKMSKRMDEEEEQARQARPREEQGVAHYCGARQLAFPWYEA